MQDQGDEMQDQRECRTRGTRHRTRGTGQEDAEGASLIPPHPRQSLLSSFLPSAWLPRARTCTHAHTHPAPYLLRSIRHPRGPAH